MQEEVKKTKVDNNYYVYLHRKKSDGTVFYVGKGKGKRAWDFRERNRFWKFVANKNVVAVEIVENNLQEWYALEMERDLILKYGKRIDNIGTLVNIVDGGRGQSGFKQSEEFKIAARIRFKGEKNPNYIYGTFKFINVYTKEVYEGTYNSFNIKYGIKFLGIFKSVKHKITKGWYVEGYITDEHIKAVTCNYRGEFNPCIDIEVYSFTNINTEVVEVCKRYELEEKYSVVLSPLFSKRGTKITNGWCLTSSLIKYGKEYLSMQTSGINSGTSDKTIYSFINTKEGLKFTGRRFEFKTKYGFDLEKLFYKKPRKSCRGWKLEQD